LPAWKRGRRGPALWSLACSAGATNDMSIAGFGSGCSAPSERSWPTLGHLFSPDHPAPSAAECDAPLPLRVTDRLFIIGYPFGDKGTWPAAVWTTAPIASEPVAQYNTLPAFLVDSRSRPGQSGAPVVLHIRPDDPVWANGDVYAHEQEVIALVGLCSGRINKDSDLGMVWTNQAIREVLSTG